MSTVTLPILNMPTRTPSASVAVSYQGVSFFYRSEDGGQKQVLENVTLDVHEGERLGVLGPNGGGKSTLLKLTLGLLDGYSGQIRIMGRSPKDARRHRLIGYVPQRMEAELRFPISARQCASMAAAVAVPAWKPLPKSLRDRVEESLDAVGALAFADAPVGTLSGGQLQRVMIARALAAEPKILVLDEPTVGIDPAGQQQFAELLVGLNQRLGLTMIVVSHDLRTIAAGSDRVACLSRTLHSHTAPSGLTPEVLAEVFRHDVAAIFGDVHIDAHKASACGHPSHKH